MKLEFSRSGEFLYDVSRSTYRGSRPIVTLDDINAEISTLASRVAELEAENKRLREALRGLDEARGGCIVDPPCGGCVACDAHAALEAQP